MFGPFRITNPLSGGLLWKIPWRLSKFQKRRHRLRLRAVDDVVATVDSALTKKGETLEALERWKAEMPTEAEMLPRDKYTMFDRKAKRYRKGIHRTFGPGVKSRGSGSSVLILFVIRYSEVDKSHSENQPSWILETAAETDRPTTTAFSWAPSKAPSTTAELNHLLPRVPLFVGSL